MRYLTFIILANLPTTITANAVSAPSFFLDLLFTQQAAR